MLVLAVHERKQQLIGSRDKDMRVAHQFKCDNLSHLPITPTALYALAAPSTPDEIRQAALEVKSVKFTSFKPKNRFPGERWRNLGAS